MKNIRHLYFFSLIIVFVVLISLISCKGDKTEETNQNSYDHTLPEVEYVGRESCKSCHEKEYNLFLGSDHDEAMDHATEATVLGDFNNATLTHFGVTSTFFIRDGKYYVNTEGPEGKMSDFEISYVFGVRPLQQYLIEFPGGRYQCLPLCWDDRPENKGGQHWYHIYSDERIAPDDVLFWTRITQNWNYMCAECHSTNLRKNYNYEEKQYHTSWSEIDVSCEACHGPGSEHLKWAEVVESGGNPESFPDLGLVIRLMDTDNATWIFDPDSVTARRSVPRQSDQLVQMCSRCHSRRAVTTEAYFHGGSLLNTHWPSVLDEGLYFADGQIQDEVYVYGSFLQSKMYKAGVVCKDCHESHSGKVFVQGNALCYRCHMATEYGTRKHHFHDPQKEGASCFECHMHERTYMGVDPRRDHSIRIPRPDLSDKLGTPNTCNQCHAEKSTKWATNYLREWYGDDLVGSYHYGETFHAGRLGYPEAHDELIALAGNLDNPPMIRATAVSLLGNYPHSSTTELLKKLITDKDPLIRYSAINVIQSSEPEVIRDFCLPRLKDTIMLVRILAANTLASIPQELIPIGYKPVLQNTLEEYKNSLMINADHPSTHLNFGNLYLNLGELAKAESSYKEAIELEPGLVAPYINLADLYRRLERDNEGKILLEKSLETYPELAPLHYALGMLLIRQGNNNGGITHIRQAAELAPQEPHYTYVYGVALNSMGQPGEAIKILQSGLARHPYDRNILLTISTLHMESGDRENALKYAQILVEYYPEDPRYQQLLTYIQSQ